MANSDKNIKITPNTGESASPKIEVTGADNATKTITINDDGTISFDSTIAATSGSIANGNANLVTGDAVYDYIVASPLTVGSIIEASGTSTLKLKAGSSFIDILDGGVSNHINVTPASGRLNLFAETIAIGEADSTITTGGTYDLTMNTNGGTNSGSIKILDGANGNIELDNNGSGQVVFKGNSTKGSGQFVLNCEQNSHGITIKGPPHSAGASYTLTLPDDDGSANQVLKTDGSGNLSWVAQSSGSPAGSDTFIQYNNGGSFGATTLAFDDTAGSEQILLDDTSDVALMKIVQRGTGSSFEVHDEASDSTVFQVSSSGGTSIGLGAGSGAGADLLFVQGRASAQILTASTDGSASAPVFTRRTDLNTGMYFVGSDNIGFTTGGTLRADISDSGLLLGGSGARVTTVLDEDDMSSDSATALATQQSIKAYVDNNAGGGGASLANGVNNRVVTATGASGLNGEANLTFDGSTLSLNDAGLDIREQYGRINFKKDASTGFVNNYAIFFYDTNDSIKGAINFNNSGSRLGFNANGDYQLYLQDGVFYPVTDDDVDLGKSTNKFKDSFFGLVDAENFKINGGQGSDGQVLTSTGSGVAWEDVSGGGSGISNISEDTTPQLGGDLDVNGNKITSASNADVTIEPNGTGDVNLFTDTVIVGDSNTNFQLQHRTTTASILQFQSGGNTRLNSDGNIYLNSNQGSSGSLIRLNGNTITCGSPSANVTISTQGAGDLTLNTNSGTNTGAIKIFDGVNGNITLTPNGTGNVSIGNFTFDADQSVGSSQDNYVLTYDHSAGTISLEAASGGGGASALDDLSDVVTTATSNIGIGSTALDSLTASSGNYNVAIGVNAGTAITTGDNNILLGFEAGHDLTTGGYNVLIGHLAGSELSASTAQYNTFMGNQAGRKATGQQNVFIGKSSGYNNEGNYNTAVGTDTLVTYQAKTAQRNVAVGNGVLRVIESGQKNTSVGAYSGGAITTGNYNTILGYTAGDTINTGEYNILLGYEAGDNITSGSGNVVIGAADVTANENDQLSISSGDGDVTWITGDSSGHVTTGSKITSTSATLSGSSLADGASFTLATVPTTTRGFKATIYVKDTSNTEYQIEEIMGYNTGSGVDFTSFGQVYSGSAAIGSLNATDSSGTTLIQFTNAQGSAINYQASISLTHMALS